MSSVAKVFHILETIVSHQERGLAYSEVVAQTQLPKATAHRVLKSLVEMGYLRFDAEAARYSGDLKLALLGSAVTSHFDLKGYVRPHLRALQAETRHTCNLGVLTGMPGSIWTSSNRPRRSAIKLYSDIGKRFPLHCTGMGKILLAGMQPAEATQDPRAPARGVHAPHHHRSRRAQARAGPGATAAGMRWIARRSREGSCASRRRSGTEGETVAAISVAFPAYISRERGMRDDIRVVTRCAAAITAALQGSGASATSAERG